MKESSVRWERRLLASGAVAALLQLAGVAYFAIAAAPHMPPIDAPHAQHAAFYSDYWAENGLANYLNVLPMPFFLLFLGGLLTRLRRAEGDGGALTTTAVVAGAALSMVWPIGIVIASTGQGMAKHGLDPATVFAFDSVAQTLLALSAFPRSVFLLAVSAVTLQAALCPRWLGWTGAGLGLVALATSAMLLVFELFPFLAIGSLLFQVWLLALSAALVSRPPEPSAAASRPLALAAH